MLQQLTNAQYQQYAHDGVTYPVRVLAPDEVARFRSACDELEMRLGGIPRTPEVRQMHLHFRWAYELATHPCVLDAAEDVLGEDLLVWATELFAKHPGDTGISIRWHRDQPYIGFDPKHTVTAWIALSPSEVTNGCMRVVPHPLEEEASRSSTTGSLDMEAMNRLAIDVQLQPGEMSLHDSRVLHGSGANRSTEKRVGFVIRFMTPAAQGLGSQVPAILARGRDDYHHFQLVDPPSADFSADTLNSMKRSAAAHLESMLENLKVKTPRS